MSDGRKASAGAGRIVEDAAMTNDLVAFLKAHLDEDADLAWRCDGAEFSAGGRARLRTRSGVRGVLPSRPPST
jgi:hypothetical protein